MPADQTDPYGGPALAATVLALAGVRRGGRVLDVGAGSTLYARPAAAAATSSGLVVSCDEMNAVAADGRTRDPDWATVVRVVARLDQLPVGPSTFDTVVHAPVAGPREDLTGIARELRRAARPGARVVVAVRIASAPADTALLVAVGFEIVHLAEHGGGGARIGHVVARPSA